MISSCLQCIALDVGAQVEAFYATLGLRPWWGFGNKAGGRQSGRTTHGLLEALALARNHERPDVVITTPYGLGHQKRVAFQLERMCEVLGLKSWIRIRMDSRGLPRHVWYADHARPVLI